jgi:molybdopterin-guanine dinucleotide biosynthesis adapter protein
MHSIMSIVGKSGSGKTTLVESLIPELNKRGYKVAVVKHSHHPIAGDEKDTTRFNQAGSEFSVINSLDNLAIFRKIDHFFEPQEISNYIMWDYDLILTEGFKSSNNPKIEVHRKEQGKDLVTDHKHLLAVVTDEPLKIDVPQFSSSEVSRIADFIESNVLKPGKNDIDLTVNGVPVPVSTSLGELLTRTLIAMVPDSKDNGGIKSLHVSLRRKN